MAEMNVFSLFTGTKSIHIFLVGTEGKKLAHNGEFGPTGGKLGHTEEKKESIGGETRDKMKVKGPP